MDTTPSLKKTHFYFCCLLLIESVWLLLMLDEISLSSYESRHLQADHYIIGMLTDFSTSLLGLNNYGYRLPFVFIYLCNLILLYTLALKTLKQPIDALWTVGIFALTPIANLSALIISNAGVNLCLTLMILYVHTKKWQWALYILLLLSLWVHPSFIILYIAFCTYAIGHKNIILFLFSCTLLIIRIYLGNLGIFGAPKAYFLDTIGIFALLFSPLLFIYYTYALYRIFIKEAKDLIWHVSFNALIFCLILSMRQKIPLDSFVPFMLVGIILCAKIFLSALRVRLKPFRLIYIMGFRACFSMLILCFLLLACNKFFYPFLDDPQDHFAYRFQITSELAKILKQQNIYALKIQDSRLANRLELYGIQKGGIHSLTQNPTQNAQTITIQYIGSPVATFYLSTP